MATKIELSEEQKAKLLNKLTDFCEQELAWELGQFDAEFLLRFISENVGAYYYNQGLFDAQALLQQKMELLAESLYELEKPIK